MILFSKFLDFVSYFIFFVLLIFFISKYILPIYNLLKNKKASLIIKINFNNYFYIIYVAIGYLIVRNTIKNYSLYLLIISCIFLFTIFLIGFIYNKFINKIYFFNDGIYIENNFISYKNIQSFIFKKDTNKYCILEIKYIFLEKQLVKLYKINNGSKLEIKNYISKLNINKIEK